MRLTEEQKALRAEWVEWLRANPDKQGYGALRKIEDDGKVKYCCLGAACEVLRAKPQWAEIIKPNVDGHNGFLIRGSVDHGLWTKEISEAFGFGGDTNPTLPIADEEGRKYFPTAAAANDSGFTFAQIADAIEQRTKLGEKEYLADYYYAPLDETASEPL
jgi:hypothetical protein